MQPDRKPSGAAPLTARSVVASTLLGTRPPSLPPAALVRAGEIFGIAEGTTRVALSRMLAAGELSSDDGRYTLAGRLLDRMQRQDASRRPPLKRWDGMWRQAVVVAAGRPAAQRADLRAAMRELRFAEVREGVWMRPDNIAAADPPRARGIADGQCLWMRSEVCDPEALAAQLWDLDAWAHRARALLSSMGASRRGLDKSVPPADALREGFILAASVLRHMQADPLIPPELLLGGWPGQTLRTQYDEYGRLFARRWGAWLRGAVPQPQPA